ncbi:MAG TPA: hypothetical protein VG993_12785 [Actinomycetota bacterium]|nr:hypothetical protein [Actinomycetota bacterium]
MARGSTRRSIGSVAALLILAACSSEGVEDGAGRSPSGSPASPAPSSASEVAATPEQEDGPTPEVLRFSAPRLGGGTIEGEDYSGRDVALWFWAPW